MSKPYSIYFLSTLWVLWCSLHSLLISRFFATWMARIWGAKFPYYRLVFNMFSFITLVPVVIYQQQIPAEVIFAWQGPWIMLNYGMYFVSFLLFYGGYQAYDMQYVIGIKQVREMREGIQEAKMDFSTSGILEYIRHPWYSGAILFVWAFGVITDVLLVSKIILTAYIIIGTILEERKLIHEIGTPYRDYMKRVPMLIPWKIHLK